MPNSPFLNRFFPFQAMTEPMLVDGLIALLNAGLLRTRSPDDVARSPLFQVRSQNPLHMSMLEAWSKCRTR